MRMMKSSPQEPASSDVASPSRPYTKHKVTRLGTTLCRAIAFLMLTTDVVESMHNLLDYDKEVAARKEKALSKEIEEYERLGTFCERLRDEKRRPHEYRQKLKHAHQSGNQWAGKELRRLDRDSKPHRHRGPPTNQSNRKSDPVGSSVPEEKMQEPPRSATGGGSDSPRVQRSHLPKKCSGTTFQASAVVRPYPSPRPSPKPGTQPPSGAKPDATQDSTNEHVVIRRKGNDQLVQADGLEQFQAEDLEHPQPENGDLPDASKAPGSPSPSPIPAIIALTLWGSAVGYGTGTVAGAVTDSIYHHTQVAQTWFSFMCHHPDVWITGVALLSAATLITLYACYRHSFSGLFGTPKICCRGIRPIMI